MLWTVLFQKLKRQPPKASQIYGYPYFVPIDENIERGYRKTK